MMEKFKKKLGNLLNVAFSEQLTASLPQDEQRRIRLVNYITLISIGNMLIYVLAYSMVDFQLFKHAIFFLTGGSILSFGIILLNNNGHHLLAKILLSLLTPLMMSYTALILFGAETHIQVYLFVATLIPLFLWGRKDKKYPSLIIPFIIVIYLIIELSIIPFNPLIKLPAEYISVFQKTNIMFCFAGAGLAVILQQVLYRQKEEQLESQTEALQLSQAHKAKVYSIIGHDLRGPISAFTSLTELFLEGYTRFTDERKLEIIRKLHKTSSSTSILLENLLIWSRNQSGSLTLNTEPISLFLITDEALSLYKDLIQHHQLNVQNTISKKLIVNGDSFMISTVIRNLISNAIKFTPNKGQISISATIDKNMVTVCVKDTGIGISKEDIKRLFDLLQINEISEDHSARGSGLGLLLCKDFINLHKGKLWVKSEKGMGSEFYFTLPLQ